MSSRITPRNCETESPRDADLPRHVTYGIVVLNIATQSTNDKNGNRRMAIGSVKWFNPTKGFGFIEPEEGGQDAFVHISAVEQSGLETLREGQRIQYELVPGRNGKSAAENLVALD